MEKSKKSKKFLEQLRDFLSGGVSREVAQTEKTTEEPTESYFIVSIDEMGMLLGKYNPEYHVFYGKEFWHFRDCFLSDEMKAKVKLGATVYGKNRNIEDISDDVNPDILKEILEKEALNEKLEKEYIELGHYYHQPATENILRNYFQRKAASGQTIDPYILESVIKLSEAMGIRVGQHDTSWTGLAYLAEVEIVGDALYNLVSEYISKLNDNEQICFYLYFPRSKNYEEFLAELDKRTGYDFNSAWYEAEKRARSIYGSAMEYKLHDAGEYYNATMENYEKFIKQKPVVYISKNEMVYSPDESAITSNAIKITREQCIEKYNDSLSAKKI